MDFNYKLERISGFCCPNKTLVIINGINICFCNSKKKAQKIIEYAFTKDESILKDKVLKNKIMSAINLKKSA